MLGNYIMSEYLRAAKAVLKAQMDRENSWNGKEYLKVAAKCYQEAYEEYNLSEALTNLLFICDYWWNDIQDWAENIIDSELGKLPKD